MSSREPSVLLYDGTCVMCSRLVPWIVEHESDKELRFSALQSERAVELLRQRGLVDVDFETMYVVEDGRVYTRSDAVAHFARHLRWPWRAMTYLVAVPRPIRDSLYRWVARHRYRWFGTTDMCEVPSVSLRGRILA